MTEFVEVKTQQMVGAALNWATFCAIYKGMQPTIHVIEARTHEMQGLLKPIEFPRAVSLTYSGAYGVECHWNPSGDWEEGGPLIQKHAITLTPFSMSFNGPLDYWTAEPWAPGTVPQDGNTPLIAACRAIVASVLGATVSVPKELTV